MSVDRFAAAVDAARAATSRTDRHMPIVEFLKDSEALAGMEEPALHDPNGVESLVIELSSLPGMSGIAGRVRALFKDGASRARQRMRESLRVVEQGEERKPERLADHLPALDIPDRYVVTMRGIQEKKETPNGIELVRLTRRPILPTIVLADIDTGARSVQLEWRERKTWRSRIVPVNRVQDPRRFVDDLSVWGAPVAAHNGAKVARFLDDVAECNVGNIPRAWVASRMGWMRGGDLGFAYGQRVIGSEHVRVELDPDGSEVQMADALRTEGNEEEWLSAVARVAEFPGAMIALYAAISGPLLVALPSAPNAIIGWCGETSTGKTTVLRLAASVFGNPDERSMGLVQKWNQTRAYLERMAAFLGSLPVCLDDTNDVSDGDRELIPKMLYQFAGGKGKGRAKVTGTQKVESWRSPLLSTGEAALTSYSQDAGVRARTLVLSGPPFGPGSQEVLVSDVTLACLDNYGHLGPRVVQYLLDHRSEWPVMAERYTQRCARYSEMATSTATKRLAQTVALLEEAKLLGEACGLPAPKCDPIAFAWDAAKACGADTDRPLAALKAVHGWAVAHSAEFWGRHISERDGTARQPSRGWAGKWAGEDWDRIAFLPDCLERVLKYHGYDPGAVLPLWQERGWLVTSEGRRTCRVRIDRDNVRCVGIRRGAVDAVVGP